MGYYMQAANGQLSLLAAAKPIDRWLSDPKVEKDLKDRLARVQEIRAFAAQYLSLPDNGSFRSYVSLDRHYVMWNVVAAPELSLQPERWCFPIAGCVDYRGYYSYQQAQAYAQKLKLKGFDVRVSGVPAYSTLGWFSDPVLSTYIHYPDAELARLVFHELAHQLAYVPGDSRFNESFATAVEEIGVAQWLELQASEPERKNYAAVQERRNRFMALLERCRARLDLLYQSDENDAEKRSKKHALFAELQTDYAELKQSWGGYNYYDHWFSEPVSNAHFALLSTYHELVPAFRVMLNENAGLSAYYRAVKKLAGMTAEKRKMTLQHYMEIAQQASNRVENQTAALQ